MKNSVNIIFGGLLGVCAVNADAKVSAGAGQEQETKPNILFIIADDLRPELGCYGVEGVRTPNIDRLAAKGTLFDNAYCNIPVSGASRASMLTGVYPRYPDRFVAFNASASKDCPEAVPMSQWFGNNGYHTISNGKVFHNIADHADTWSEYPWRVNPEGYGKDWAEYNKWELWLNSASANSINPRTMRGPFCESADVSDCAYEDGKGALRTIEDMKRMKELGKPFFIACGFWRPHLPFNAPKKYWDMYDRCGIPLPDNMYRPENLPEQVKSSTEITQYACVESVEDLDFLRKVKHGYWASVSYIDAQIGLILDALDELELADNTVVVIVGDHGWHLGEHQFIGKHNLMRVSTRIPLIIYAPGKRPGIVNSVAEMVDLYPTFCELAGIPQPPEQLDGKTLVPMLGNPSSDSRHYGYVQWGAGDNVVDGRYSYSEWRRNNEIIARMIFDHEEDPDENRNVVDSAAPEIINTYSGQVVKMREYVKKEN